LAEIKHQGEPKLQYSEPPVCGRLLHAFTKRTAGAACQAPPYRPAEPGSTGRGISNTPACSSAPLGLCSTGPLDHPKTPTPQAHTISAGPTPNKPAKLVIHRHCRTSTGTTPLRPAKPAIHRPHRISARTMPLRLAQSPLGHVPQGRNQRNRNKKKHTKN
jgi:hypothetical protein